VTVSVVAALIPSVVLAAWRVVAREPLTQALSGVLGIGLGAGIALYTGRAQDFFLPSILKNIGLGAVYAITAVVRWPLVGVLLGFTLGEDLNWRRVRPRMRVYQQATWLWAGVFAVRAAVQAWLYSTGQAAALGFVNILLGLPLFGLAVGLTWMLVRRVPAAKPAAEPAQEEPAQNEQAQDEQAQDEPVRAEAARD